MNDDERLQTVRTHSTIRQALARIAELEAALAGWPDRDAELGKLVKEQQQVLDLELREQNRRGRGPLPPVPALLERRALAQQREDMIEEMDLLKSNLPKLESRLLDDLKLTDGVNDKLAALESETRMAAGRCRELVNRINRADELVSELNGLRDQVARSWSIDFSIPPVLAELRAAKPWLVAVQAAQEAADKAAKAVDAPDEELERLSGEVAAYQRALNAAGAEYRRTEAGRKIWRVVREAMLAFNGQADMHDVNSPQRAELLAAAEAAHANFWKAAAMFGGLAEKPDLYPRVNG